jgi:hypothetical protein
MEELRIVVVNVEIKHEMAWKAFRNGVEGLKLFGF